MPTAPVRLNLRLSLSVLALVVLLADGATPQSTGQNPATPPTATQFSALIDAWGPTTPQPLWSMRRMMANAFDQMSLVPPNVSIHPLSHTTHATFFNELMSLRLERVLQDLESATPPATGVRIYKLYSSSFIVRGNGVTVGFDLSDSPFVYLGQEPWTPSQVTRLAAQLDVLFISHIHADHYSIGVVLEMARLGKLIAVTPEIFGIAALIAPELLPALFIPPHDQTITLFGTLDVSTYLGAQYFSFIDVANAIPDPASGSAQNNAFIVKLGGVAFAHFGDVNDPGIFPWVFAKVFFEGVHVHVTANLGLWGGVLAGWMTPDLRLMAHDHEFSHPPSGFLLFNMGPAPDLNRFILLWGEWVDVVP